MEIQKETTAGNTVTTTGNGVPGDDTAPVTTAKVSPAAKKTLLILNCILLTIGNSGGPLIIRLYFIHGGNRVWLSSFLQSAGWPVIALILIILYLHRRSTVSNANHPTKTTSFLYMRPRLFLAASFIGLLTSAITYLYAYGVARLPISTSTLIVSSQLSFTALFALLLVKHKFTPYSVNAVVLLTIGSAVLALRGGADKPAGESNKDYVIGFVTTVAAAVLNGLALPLLELTYYKAKQTITYTVVLETQTVMCFVATVFCIVGMIVNHDFKVIPREAMEFELGKTKYYVILCVTTLFWQCFFLGSIGVIFCASSLLSGVMIALLLPVTEVLAVVFFKEKFQVEKGVALVLSLWGFCSYFYGEYRTLQKAKKNTQSSQESVELPQTQYSQA